MRMQRRRIVSSGRPARSASTMARRKTDGRSRMCSDDATTFIVPPHRMAIGGSGSPPNAWPSAVTVLCKVPSPPCTAMTVGGVRRHSATAAFSSSIVLGANTRPRSPTSAWKSAAIRGLRRFARDRGLTMTAIMLVCAGRSLVGVRVVSAVVVAARVFFSGRQLRRHFGDLGIPALEHGGDLPGLLLVRDVERRLLAVAALALLEPDDRHLRRPELALGAVQLLEQEHHRRPAALGQDRAIQLLADEDTLVLVIVRQLFERFRHLPSGEPRDGGAIIGR